MEGREREGPKLLLNQGPSETCYATAGRPGIAECWHVGGGDLSGALHVFSVAGPTAWNALPDDLRDPSLSADNFRKRLKTHLSRNALGHVAHYRRCVMRYINLRLKPTYLLIIPVVPAVISIIFCGANPGCRTFILVAADPACENWSLKRVLLCRVSSTTSHAARHKSFQLSTAYVRSANVRPNGCILSFWLVSVIVIIIPRS